MHRGQSLKWSIYILCISLQTKGFENKIQVNRSKKETNILFSKLQAKMTLCWYLCCYWYWCYCCCWYCHWYWWWIFQCLEFYIQNDSVLLLCAILSKCSCGGKLSSEKESSGKLVGRFWKLPSSLKLFQFKCHFICVRSQQTEEHLTFHNIYKTEKS